MTLMPVTEFETLNAPAPDVSPEFVCQIALDHFGICVRDVERLTAERDQNLRIHDRSGSQWVMKISNPMEPRAITDFQTSALCHLEQTAPDVPVPRVKRTLQGATGAVVTLPDERASLVRLLTWMDGRPLTTAPKSSRQRRNLASCLARLGKALADFTHPAQDVYLQWDISHIQRVAPLLSAIDDETISRMVTGVLADVETISRPVAAGLRRQVIYNDLNYYNVLVDSSDPDRIAGIIDFGDIVAAPLINDLAVAASYQFDSSGNRTHAGEFIKAYHDELPLNEDEIQLLSHLIETRLALTLLITSFRAKQHPENASYILRNNQPARVALAEMRSRNHQENLKWIRNTLEMKA